MALFGKPKYTIVRVKKKEMPDGLWTKCEQYSETLYNKIIEENINIIAECEIKAAGDYLEKFSKIKVFWKKDLKKAAIKALARWHDRKD